MSRYKYTSQGFKIIIIALILIFNIFPSSAVNQNYKTLSLGEAILLGIKNSQDIKDTRLELVKKQIELKEAKEALADIRKKESTVRFSLLFDIKMPEKHGLPKEIELIMKIPTIESKITELLKKLAYDRLNARFTTENAFMDTVELMDSVEKDRTLLENYQNAVKRIYADLILGNDSEEDYEYLKQETDKQETKYAQDLMRFENVKSKLGEITGIDVSTGYTFGKDFSMLKLTRDNLDEIIKFSVDNDFGLFKAGQESRIAEKKLSELKNIYSNRWGDKVSLIEQELQKFGEMDYADFLEKYQQALDNIEDPWKGSYEISLLFFKISIPKDWFKGEFDGIRYFEDQKYALYLALIDRDKAVKAEEKVKKELIKKLNDNYLAVKEFELAYQDSAKVVQRYKEAYEKVKLLNMLGRAGFKDVESARNAALQSESAEFSGLLQYNKAISMFNFNSSGIIDKYKDGASFRRGSYDLGNLFKDLIDKDAENPEKPEWYLQVTSTDLIFEFGLSIPKSSGIEATHYTLSNEGGQVIGEKTEITKTIRHLPITFKNSSKLILRLYKGGSIIYKAEIDGLTYGGELVLERVPPVEEKNVLGSWEIKTLNGLTSSLELKVNSTIIEAYENYSLSVINESNETVLTSPVSLNTAAVHLSSILKPDKVIIYLFKKDGSKDKALLFTENGRNILRKIND